MLESIEEKIIKYCNRYYLIHGEPLTDLYINCSEYAEFSRDMASRWAPATMVSNTTGYQNLSYRVGKAQVRIIASKNSMLSDKNALQRLKERYGKK